MKNVGDQKMRDRDVRKKKLQYSKKSRLLLIHSQP